MDSEDASEEATGATLPAWGSSWQHRAVGQNSRPQGRQKK